ncbi:uncharacterized protein LOC132755313 [Ruditapes philippinarum]|uniref:uncharacterized protein LOC132755313 n=1 Tax=Ruditapes philippinarum TaxID=129788 RepID=UPI00295C0366|nr:uncharacterized protein LOC132755313 [Ruditapes philippinarum]
MADRTRDMLRDNWTTLPYFHDHFKSVDDVSHFIKKKSKGKSGSFLLRPSNRNRDLLTASVLVPDKSVRHTHIQIEFDASRGCWKYFLVVEKKFDSVDQLIDYYKQNPVKNLENVNNVYFLNPIYRSDVNANLYTEQNGSSSGRFQSNRTNSLSSLSISSRTSERSFDSLKGIPPPLPVRPLNRTQSTDSSSGTWGSNSSHVNTLPNNDIGNRPPLPLPEAPEKKEDGGAYGYSRARDVSEDISEKLKDVLKSSERCECGIPRNLAELPMGWTVHLSKDPLTRGKLFYQSEDGVTSWQLPQQVEMQLNKVHISNLRQIDQNWNVRRQSGTSLNRV